MKRRRRRAWAFISLLVVALLLGACTANHGQAAKDGSEESITSTQLMEATNEGASEASTVEDSASTEQHLEESEAMEPEAEFAVHNGIDDLLAPNLWYKIYPLQPEVEPIGNYALLTIDDAPKGETTLLILDALDQYNAKAIFFVNGIYAVERPELLKEIVDRGHLIGNHTWSHPSVEEQKRMTVQALRDEVTQLQAYVEAITGERPRFFRPPHGYRNPTFLELCEEEGMQVMNWTTSLEDWKQTDVEGMLQSLEMYLAKKGANILTHDFPATAENYGAILQHLVDQEYQFVIPTTVITAEEERAQLSTKE